MIATVVTETSYRRSRPAAVLLAVSVATLWAPAPRAGAAQADCKRPPGTASWACLWTEPDYAGTMTLYEGTGRTRTAECHDETPRSAVNNGPPKGKGRYAFYFYKHPGCEKGGKAAGILAPGNSDPDLPGVQSYVWTDSTP